METVFRAVYEALAGELRDVYPAFDAVPLVEKSDRRIAVVEPVRLTVAPGFPDGAGGARPFKLEVRVSLLTAMTVPLEAAMAYLEDEIVPRMQSLGAVTVTSEPPTADLRLRRVVTRTVFMFTGLFLGEEEADAVSVR